MLNTIREFYNRYINIDAPEKEGDATHRLQLATTALLIEMMRMDEEIHEQEKQTLLDSVAAKFDITHQEAEEIIRLAEEELADATDYHQFTTLINQGFDMDQKIRMVEYLWLIAAADDHIDHYEEHLVRRIAELLYVPHRDFIAAKHRALGK